MANGHGGARANSGPRAGGRNEDDEELLRQRIRSEKAKADRAEFDLDVERGRYLLREMVQAAAATLLSNFAQGMRSLEPDMEREGFDPEVCRRVGAKVDESLAALAEGIKRLTEMPGAAA